jgi:hypothetical protein
VVLRVKDEVFAKKFEVMIERLGLRPRKGKESESYRVAVTSEILHNFLRRIKERGDIDGLNAYLIFEGLFEGDGSF